MSLNVKEESVIKTLMTTMHHQTQPYLEQKPDHNASPLESFLEKNLHQSLLESQSKLFADGVTAESLCVSLVDTATAITDEEETRQKNAIEKT